MANAGTTTILPEQLGKPLEESLDHLVENSNTVSWGEGKDVLAPSEQRAQDDAQSDAVHSHGAKSRKWIKKFFPSEETLDKLFAMEHMGNFVIDRTTGKKIFETMPIYVRVGMHLLFVSGCSYMSYSSVEKLLENQSIKQGKIYDQTGPEVKEHIESFIKTYDLPLEELLVKDLDQYPTFNSFFSRRLVPTARPITSPSDPSIVISPADCRMTVFNTVDQAKQLWIKGKQFTLPSLLTGDDDTETRFKEVQNDSTAAVSVARLAPQDYHRFHSPVEGVVGDIKDIHAVNPQAINEDLNVFTLNKRSVMLIHANFGPGRESVPIAFVAIGAMLVGSIGWSKKPGDKVLKGEELGWFQYGGSTTITVFPSKSGVAFDDDLVKNSENGMETLVRVGMEMGKVKQ
ncbi:phosphatidylserine decarboxylase [Kwoniella bestiolae CBS 10118]|uniref:Phosphatidylserine decarboxylase n=1 Tax=Kwoniella bestiolae CBS 10118 TaxID=1296100 RepID=A0A1B9G680_9TREE|nr:phosphatidylserine decarboxylase [Kwoniella bestiolae CBS 10118]OCF26510.1 phosphatidylserine decarboxylase [Kwoniella bestiolae CBS 10118]